ncbi:MAG: alpha/beta hydrolase [Promethearchaeia archaeon]
MRKWFKNLPPLHLHMWKDAQHEFLNVNNLRIHAVSMGYNNSNKKDTPILLLHGFPDFHYSFRYIMPILARNRKAIAIDQRGYNKSSKPPNVKDYGMKYLMEDIKEVILSISPTNKVILVGHDWGGAISWHMARYFPELIENLVIINCPPVDLLFRAFQHIPRQLFMSYYIFFFQIPYLPEIILGLNNFWIIQRIYKNIGDHISEREMQAYIDCFNRPRGLSGINYYRASLRAAFKPSTSSGKFKRVKCDTLVLWGVNDFALHFNLTRYLPYYIDKKCNLIIRYYKHAGHFLHQEKPLLVANRILEFIKSR